jgi:DNA-binding XRE family transcriptional regulator
MEPSMENPMVELRRYRELRRRRDGLIRRARKAGYTRAQVAQAAGLSPDRIKQISRKRSN